MDGREHEACLKFGKRAQNAQNAKPDAPSDFTLSTFENRRAQNAQNPNNTC